VTPQNTILVKRVVGMAIAPKLKETIQTIFYFWNHNTEFVLRIQKDKMSKKRRKWQENKGYFFVFILS